MPLLPFFPFASSLFHICGIWHIMYTEYHVQVNSYRSWTKIRNRKVYCFFVFVSIGICDILHIFIWRVVCISLPIWFIHLLLPNGLVEMEVLICLYQHVLLSLVKQDASMPYPKLAPSHPIPTWLFQYSCWEYALLLPFSPFFLHPKWPTLRLEVVNCLPSLFILSLLVHRCHTYLLKLCFYHVAPQKLQWLHWLPNHLLTYSYPVL